MDVNSFKWEKPDWRLWRRRINKAQYLDDMGSNIDRESLYLFLNDIIEEYSKIINIPFSEFESIFKEKNRAAYYLISREFTDEIIRYTINSVEMQRIYKALIIPDISTENVEELINKLMNLSEWEKVKFFERIESIKSELKV